MLKIKFIIIAKVDKSGSNLKILTNS